MPRLTLKLLLRVFIVVLLLLFILPFLVNKLETNESDKALQALNRISKKSSHEVNNDLKFKPQVEKPKLQEEDNKSYGPKAVFKSGVIGNFEPEIISRPGPGEMGAPVEVPADKRELAQQTISEFGFNMVASDQIAMNRNIPDTRLDECKYWHYPEHLPTASVIIVFHNEGWSTLMRTVHSVINTSPPHLLKEVVMVDDYSDKEHLKSRLDEYIKQFNGKVKLYRNKERLGLIMTRTLGARYSTGQAIVFLDAHCECNRNWLVPLLARIAYDRTKMAVPIVDGIDWNRFSYASVYGARSHFRGIFEWGFLYKESEVPAKELLKRKFNSEPYSAPTHAGGLFAIDRSYFFEMGAYDPGLQIWGGENFELSFKIWLCGGSIEWVPCSRVGHVYRNHMPYSFGKINPKIPVILINYMRVVEVWMDPEFKEYFYTREPTIRGYPIGNITAQLEFKKKHQKRSFKWFMENIAYEVYEKFPPPPPNVGWGEIKERYGSRCFDQMGQSLNGGPIGVSQCHHLGGNQLFRLNTKGQLAVGERCMLESAGGISQQYCPTAPIGPWEYNKVTGQIRHSSLQQCVEADKSTSKLFLSRCNGNALKQKWDINNVRTW